MNKKIIHLMNDIDKLAEKVQKIQHLLNKPYLSDLDKLSVGCRFIGKQMLIGYIASVFLIGLGLYSGWENGFSDLFSIGLIAGFGVGLIFVLFLIKLFFVYRTKKKLLGIKKEISQFTSGLGSL